MKKIVLVAFVSMMTACGTQNKSTLSTLADSTSQIIEFTGKDGQDVFQALNEMSVIDTDRLIGAMNLQVESLRCSKLIIVPEGSDRQASCQFIRKNNDGSHEIVNFTGKAPEVMLEVLSRHGAATNGGINANAVAAKLMHCSLAVYPNAVPKCFLEI